MRLVVIGALLFFGLSAPAQSLLGTWEVDSCLIEDARINYLNNLYQTDTKMRLEFTFNADSVWVKSTAIMSGKGVYITSDNEITIDYKSAGGQIQWSYQLSFTEDRMIWRFSDEFRNEYLELIPLR
jgi:hypothetical protein